RRTEGCKNTLSRLENRVCDRSAAAEVSLPAAVGRKAVKILSVAWKTGSAIGRPRRKFRRRQPSAAFSYQSRRNQPIL
ncbi:MAG: hypothetical protein LBO73_03890, partial [Holosporaceae bacterium]|nr:hypothetical protein [Holosporaceae bacterium]